MPTSHEVMRTERQAAERKTRCIAASRDKKTAEAFLRTIAPRYPDDYFHIQAVRRESKTSSG